MKLSLRARLVILYTTTMAFLVIAFFIFVYMNFSYAIFSSDINERFDKKLSQYAGSVAEDLSKKHGPFYSSIQRYREEFDRLVYYDFFLRPSYGQVRDFPASLDDPPIILIKNRALGKHYIVLSRETFRRLGSERFVVENMDGVMDFPLRVISTKFSDVDGQRYLLQIGMTMKDIQTTIRTVLIRSLLVGPLLLGIISLAGYLFVRRSFSPVREIVKLARRITAEDLSHRLSPAVGGDAVADLTDTLNDMIARLERSFIQVRQFTDDVSHELRTPLTIIKGEIEVAVRHARSGEEYRRILGSVHEEVEKLEKIVADLLFLSRMDAGRVEKRFGPVELTRIILEAYEDIHPLAQGKGVAVDFAAFSEATVIGDAGLLKRLFFNLLANAVQYTPEGGRVTISCEEPENASRGVLCSISDTGKGIPAASHSRIFDRFYRVDASRSHTTGGTGLGLAIVKKILELHNGTVRVESEPGRGTAFFINFPKIHNY